MGNPKDKLQGIVNKSQESEQRFAYALMAADLDFEVAKLAGWAYVDKDVKPSERYLYTIYHQSKKHFHREQWSWRKKAMLWLLLLKM